jgi:hypothetical protein
LDVSIDRWTHIIFGVVAVYGHSHDAVKTSNGVLNITLDVHPQTFTYTDRTGGSSKQPPKDIKINITKEFRSGMVQSWNKFCFIGGIIEISAKLPGDPRTGGLWPASKFESLLCLWNVVCFGTPYHLWLFSFYSVDVGELSKSNIP